METFELNMGFKIFFWIFGIIALPLFLVGLVIILLALKARATVTDDHLEYWWLGLKKVTWDDIAEFHPASSSGGILGGMMNPHSIVRTSGKRMNMPVGTFKRSKELIAIIRARAGLETET